MATFTIEVDLKWYDSEDGTLDEVLEERILSGVIAKISNQVSNQVESKIGNFISEQVTEIANEKLIEQIDNFFDTEFTKVDRWGDVIKTTTPKTELKNMLDGFLKDKVDSDGRLTTDSWNNNKNRMEYILDRTAQKHIEQYKKGIAQQVLEGIKDDINKEAQQRVVDSILSDYNLKKLIGK